MEKVQENVVIRFNDCMNMQDIEGLASVMTDDHSLSIETKREHSRVEGKDACIEA